MIRYGSPGHARATPLTAVPGERLELLLDHDPHRLDGAVAERMARQPRGLLRTLADRPGTTVADLETGRRPG